MFAGASCLWQSVTFKVKSRSTNANQDSRYPLEGCLCHWGYAYRESKNFDMESTNDKDIWNWTYNRVHLFSVWSNLYIGICLSTFRINSPLIACIFSDQISYVWKQGELHHGPNEEGSPSSHMLPIAYCLRAFCTQEADPNSKVQMRIT